MLENTVGGVGKKHPENCFKTAVPTESELQESVGEAKGKRQKGIPRSAELQPVLPQAVLHPACILRLFILRQQTL